MFVSGCRCLLVNRCEGATSALSKRTREEALTAIISQQYLLSRGGQQTVAALRSDTRRDCGAAPSIFRGSYLRRSLFVSDTPRGDDPSPVTPARRRSLLCRFEQQAASKSRRPRPPSSVITAAMFAGAVRRCSIQPCSALIRSQSRHSPVPAQPRRLNHCFCTYGR